MTRFAKRPTWCKRRWLDVASTYGDDRAVAAIERLKSGIAVHADELGNLFDGSAIFGGSSPAASLRRLAVAGIA